MTDLAAPTLDPATAVQASSAPDALQLSEQLFAGVIAAIELGTIHLGQELGLYSVLQEGGAMTPSDLARRAGIDARYAREWLEQQAMAQLVACHDATAAPEARRYELLPATATVLLDADSPAFLGPLAKVSVGIMRVARDLERAYRTGGGVAFGEYGHEVRHGLGVLNGAAYDREMSGWLAALPDLDAALQERVEPRILDLGCGTGRSTLALARAYPHAQVRGIDLDLPSIEEARATAAEAGVANRVTFAVGDVAAAAAGDGFDLVTIFEALHDMGDPVGALARAREALRADGAVLIADQLTRETFVADGDPLERFQYACSVMHCLPATRAEDHVVAHGTVIRPDTVDEWARRAGFGGAVALDIEDPFWRFYRLGWTGPS